MIDYIIIGMVVVAIAIVVYWKMKHKGEGCGDCSGCQSCMMKDKCSSVKKDEKDKDRS